MPLDFHAPTETHFNLQVHVNERLKTNLRRRKRRLLGVLKFEKIRVTNWHIQTLPHQIQSTFGQVCPYSHYNQVEKLLI